ncbi:methyltransferase type 11 [Sphaerisporangium melleum]|uniref:Methyltransferase type 11 n=1 Tax=Sphaerisporangium melleum TaxID=321316 RepID=A0A917R619_9ACTN|nr:methyltransferase domain-containing protein [Sphaerisporangium melleum]GGK90958.1 methyltransferase type 11 [Sphaerisporangium melleum]GII72798.1 methyltransferase type 11 [Sphaerisporangium melleum]
MSSETIDSADIGIHYDQRSPIGDEFRNGQLHMWYWYDNDDDTPLKDAVHRVSRKVTETLGLRPGEHVLDAGCGPGETAVFLAKEYGVRVTGVTVSSFEIDKANERAAANGVTDRVTFEYGDYTGLTYPDDSFDAVLALESLQNAPDLQLVLGELFRVLRPGGRISFSDFSLESAAEPARVRRFMSTLKLRELPTLQEWIEHARRAGFEVEEYTQCGPRVFGKKSKYIRAAMDHRDEIAAKFGEEALAEFSRRHLGFFAPRKDQIGYVIVSARKPVR